MSGVYGVVSMGEYGRAEKFADQWAGDNEAHVVVLEADDPLAPDAPDKSRFLIMDAAEATVYLGEHEDSAFIVYEADHTPETYAGYAGEPATGGGERGEHVMSEVEEQGQEAQAEGSEAAGAEEAGAEEAAAEGSEEATAEDGE